MPAAIEIRNLHKSYDDTAALCGIDLTIKPGEFYGLLGPNGAGKTTTIGIITGLVKLESGSVSVFGKDIITDYRFTRSRIGVSPQEFTSDWFFSIEKLLIFQAGYYGIPKKVAQPRVDEVMEKLGLYEKRGDKIRFLSGGMKRRFMIAKSLVNDPDILILDEPTAGVDVELRRMLWEYLQELHEKGKTILLTTHYIEEAEMLCEDVAIIDAGKIIARGKPEDMTKQSGTAGITIQLTGWDETMKSDVSQFTFTIDGNRLHFTVKDPEESLPEIINILTKKGCHIQSIKTEKTSLEDVFLSLTGRGIEEDTGS